MTKSKKCILIFLSLICLSISITGYFNKDKKQPKLGLINKNNISEFKIGNLICEEKEIKNKSERDKTIDLINSVHITQLGIEPKLGTGYYVVIKYSNGKKFSANFGDTSMSYSYGDKAIWCDIDKNIFDDLRMIYDETKVEGIDNNARKINEIVPIKYDDITKIILSGNINKTVENKENIKEIMNLIDQYAVKQEPQEFPLNGFNISGQFFIGNKSVMNIDFVNPIRINGRSYEYKNKQLGEKTINDYLNSISLQ